MKLEVGMYVRTRYGRIYNIENIETKKVYYSCNPLEHQWQDRKFIYGERGMECTEAIKKASHKIIDLIEEGDYVNGMKVNNIAIEDGLIYLHMDADDCLHEDTMLTGDDIKSIVTKEQFESMSYKVGE